MISSLLGIPLAIIFSKTGLRRPSSLKPILATIGVGLLIGSVQLLDEHWHALVFGGAIGLFGGLLPAFFGPEPHRPQAHQPQAAHSTSPSRPSIAQRLEWLRTMAARVAIATLAGLFAGALLSLAQLGLQPATLAATFGIELATGVILYSVFAFPTVLAVLCAAGVLYVGFASRFRDTWDDDREWWARFGAWVTMTGLGWVCLVGITLLGPIVLMQLGSKFEALSLASLGGLSGLATLKLGASADTRAAGAESQGGSAAPAGWSALIKQYALVIAAPVFLVLALTGLSILVAWAIWIAGRLLTDGRAGPWPAFGLSAVHDLTASSPWYLMPMLLVGLVALSMFAAALIDLNRFSMHALYRERLIRAFLGVSNADREADPFTNFDGRDNIFLRKLAPGRFRKRDLERDTGGSRIGPPQERRLVTLLRAALRKTRTGDQKEWEAAVELSAKLSDELKRKLELEQPATGFVLRSLIDEINDLVVSHDVSSLQALQAAPNAVERTRCAPRLTCAEVLANASGLENLLPTCFNGARRERARQRAPLHVINVALNLVRSRRPALQDRKASSFTFSPLHCGSWEIGYRDAHRYGGPRGVSLGTAMTISGAAVSPNQGYHSSPFITFLLALFNIRLGLWMGNPGRAGQSTWTNAAPRLGFGPPILEAFGLTDDEHRYVYLSDGGHFDNLGLYEMVRRRVHRIIVVDAGADPGSQLDDLGNAIRKVGIDMGIPINHIDPPLRVRSRRHPKAEEESSRYFEYFEINYQVADGSHAENGFILYIKPGLYGREPADVANYAATSRSFPHESTGNQFFSEAQMESYRRLAMHELGSVLGGVKPKRLDDLFPKVTAAKEKAKIEDAAKKADATERLGSARSPSIAIEQAAIQAAVENGLTTASQPPAEPGATGADGRPRSWPERAF